MIYTVTFNPALDYVVFLDNLKLGDVNRSTRESIFYGGKGINVSTILNTLGLETTALGFVEDLQERQLRMDWQHRESTQISFICQRAIPESM